MSDLIERLKSAANIEPDRALSDLLEEAVRSFSEGIDRKDALRYRWMRANAYYNGAGEMCINADNCGRKRHLTVTDLDEAIDAEIAAEAP